MYRSYFEQLSTVPIFPISWVLYSALAPTYLPTLVLFSFANSMTTDRLYVFVVFPFLSLHAYS